MSRKAIIYTRVSTDEQAELGFSLPEQEASIKKYCVREGFEIVRHYQDDYTAKHFNRPDFQRMLNDIKLKKIKAEYLICAKIDRFSRAEPHETLRMIQKLKTDGIELLLIDQNYNLEVPENWIPYMLQIVLPYSDNLRRGLNTKKGMRQARKEGRWNGTIPKGYSWNRENGKSYIIPNEDAKYIREAFQEFSKGIYSVDEVRKIMWKRGYKCSRNNFWKVLRNPVYIGKIRIEAWRDEEEEIVNGLHEPIISDELFYTVQDLLIKRKRKTKPKNKLNDNLPLRGFLQCHKCGGNLTGSASRSHTGTRYFYYHCNRNCDERFRADEANMEFIQYLGSFIIPDEVLELYYHIMKDLFKKDDRQRENEKLNLNRQINEFEKMIENAEDKFIKNEIDKQTFENVKKRYTERINDRRLKTQEINLQNTNFMKYVDYDFSLLKNLERYYKEADISVKQKMIGSIFPGKLIYEDKKYRTPKINSVLALLTKNINNLGEIKKGQKIKFDNLSHKASPRGHIRYPCKW